MLDVSRAHRRDADSLPDEVATDGVVFGVSSSAGKIRAAGGKDLRHGMAAGKQNSSRAGGRFRLKGQVQDSGPASAGKLFHLSSVSLNEISLCNLCVLCVSVVNDATSTTETQRTRRLHREESNWIRE